MGGRNKQRGVCKNPQKNTPLMVDPLYSGNKSKSQKLSQPLKDQYFSEKKITHPFSCAVEVVDLIGLFNKEGSTYTTFSLPGSAIGL